ncbi:MAG: M1 family metallopeptidase, partial [Bacteroidota bacterium]
NGNYLFEIAQWFPRMCKYDDVYGWQNKQFLGRGEFALPFGDYDVEITAPADHMVMATGDLTNKKDVLTSTQLERLEQAYNSFDEPVVIVTEEEVREKEKEKATGTKTWKFKAEKVRDFAFASSRKFLWDAMGVKIGDRTVLAQSLYPKEGLPLWGRYSTRVVAHTLKTYSKYTIDYPYPHCASIHGPVWGMEYPMMTFNGGRPNPDGEYPLRIKYANISVIIHEVGHNFFPMIINSDERQWTWMDEGLNTFVQFLTEREWERKYPSRRGFPSSMINYMKDDKDKQMPIMTNSESILQFGNNAYGKPATALNILRETVMGREAFDFAFKKYAERWAFKHPEPADLFRTLEDASAVDLDWFWRGWFYTTDHVDMAITDVIHYEVSNDPDKRADFRRKQFEPQLKHPTYRLNETEIEQTYTEQHPETKDKYTNPDLFEVDEDERKRYEQFQEELEPEQKELLERMNYVYEIQIENKGGLVMPVILRLMYEDGSEEVMDIPAEIWRQDNHRTTKMLNLEKPLKAVELDPYRETADIDPSNNVFPPNFDERFLKISR